MFETLQAAVRHEAEARLEDIDEMLQHPSTNHDHVDDEGFATAGHFDGCRRCEVLARYDALADLLGGLRCVCGTVECFVQDLHEEAHAEIMSATGSPLPQLPVHGPLLDALADSLFMEPGDA